METDLRAILFPRTGAAVIEQIFSALCDRPYGLTNPELRAAVYSGAHEPDWAPECIQVAVCRFNRLAKRAGLGLRIRGGGGPGSRYLLYLARPKC